MRKYTFLALLASFMQFSGVFATTIPNDTSKVHQKPKNVNILTWWGYLDWAKPTIQKLDKICGANISFDNYYSNNEFLQRLNVPGVEYDIAIYSNTISKQVDQRFNLPQSTLYTLSNNYSPTFKSHYKAGGFPHNAVFFEHSLTAFIYNPKNIHITDSDSLYDIFKKAANKNVVMVDDPTEANMIVSMALNGGQYKYQNTNNLIPLSYTNFHKLTQNSKVFITNSPEHLLTLPNTAFAFQWSGDAIGEVEKQKKPKLKLMIDPRVSYITTDMLAELNTDPVTHCVATHLASKQFLSKEENHTFYISPYGNYAGHSNPLYKKTFKTIMKELPKLPWIYPLPPGKLDHINHAWQLIKLKVLGG